MTGPSSNGGPPASPHLEVGGVDPEAGPIVSASPVATLPSVDQQGSDRGPTSFNAAAECEAGQADDLTFGTRLQRVDPHTFGLPATRSTVVQGIIA